MIDYFVKVLLFQVIFLAVYDYFLKKETFFQWNRGYLLFTAFLAYVLPVLRFKSMAETVPETYVNMLPEVVLSPQRFIEARITDTEPLFGTLEWVYLAGAVLALLVFVLKLRQIVALILKNKRLKRLRYLLVLLPETNRAFSFFRYVFIGEKLPEKERIIAHELVHVKQFHTLDLLFFELQKIVFWFNPMSYFYQLRIMELHEYIADAKVVPERGKTDFYRELLAGAFRVDRLTFVNPYNKKSLIKKRITMINKIQSKEILKLKYLWLVPVLLGMLTYTSCNNTLQDDSQIMTVSKEQQDDLIKNAIPFSKLDEVPVYPGCENRTDEKACLQESISALIRDEFDYNLAEDLGLKPGKKRIYVQFIIDKNGNITDVRVRGPHEKLEQEALRVIGKLPRMQPGKLNGKAVNVKYTVPITIKVGDVEIVERLIDKSSNYQQQNDVPYAMVDQAPVYPGCENAEDAKKCLTEKIMALIGTEYNTALVNDLGLEPGKKRIYVRFIIDKNGNITDVRVRGPHEKLEQEALRVIGKLPRMQPGKLNGKAVNVKYTVPITLNIE